MNRKALTHSELQQLVEEISLKWFNRPFLHRAYFNRRLQTTGGRYHLKTGDIDFNYKVYEKFGCDELVGVIKHELCHYHLHQLGLGYKHQDSDFKQLLKQVGGSRYVQNVSDKTVIHYCCQQCHTIFERRRIVDTRRYVCGRCKGQLVKL